MSDRRLGGYELFDAIGEGGMGTVYRARQLALDREIALKVLKTGVVGLDTDARFQREMQLAAQLAHPGLVRVLDGGTVDGTAYIAMELVRGRALSDTIARYAPLAWPFALAVTSRVADALAHLHERDILHRDIKPSNILLARDGGVKLADFGLARFTDSASVTADGAVVGTLQFLAPELMVGDPATPASELWSVGCVLYAMLTGHLHVEKSGSTAFARAVVDAPLRPPEHFVQGLPPAVSQLVMTLMDRDPSTRLSNARVLCERVDDLLEQGGHHADRILQSGVLDQIAVWRALPAEAPEEAPGVVFSAAPVPGGSRGHGSSAPGAAPTRSRVLWPAVVYGLLLALALAWAFAAR